MCALGFDSACIADVAFRIFDALWRTRCMLLVREIQSWFDFCLVEHGMRGVMLEEYWSAAGAKRIGLASASILRTLSQGGYLL
jgi:hypothetical protein